MNDSQSEQTLAAIKILRQELRGVPANEELEGVLDAVIEKANRPAERDGALSSALETLNQHPTEKALLEKILRRAGTEIPQVFREFENVPGPLQPILPGTLMVCPKDPAHYTKRLRTAGQHLTCPIHKVGLVPADKARG